MRENLPQDEYMNNPGWLEARVGLLPLRDVLIRDDAHGATRLAVLASFEPERFVTCVFKRGELKVELVVAGTSIWESCFQDRHEVGTKRIEMVLGQRTFPAAFSDFDCLKEKVAHSGSCRTKTLDGVGYRHRLCSPTADLYAEWHNPSERKHHQQYELLHNYWQLLSAARIDARFLPRPAHRWWHFWR